jgi:uncharacterized protein YkwD
MNNIFLYSILVLFCASSCAVRQASSVLSSEQQASMESKILLYVNQYRNSKNLSPLVSSEPLAQIARGHSGDMQGKSKMDHHGFSGRAAKIQNQYPNASVAENVGFNYGYSMPERHIVDSWINSPGHQRNILGNYRFTGIGATKSAEGKIYYTQIFVNP